jgi:hypothetical protein
LRLAFWVLIGASLTTLFVFGQPAPQASPRPVLIELFTSEGCSDCPPADALLARLDREQFVPGVQAIVLSEHVTYWNHEGWRDPFSMQEVDERQRDYVYRFGLQDSYTPQAVVDGTTQFVGNSPNAMMQAVEQAGAAPKESITILNAHWENGGVDFSVAAPASPNTRLEAALAEDATRVKVASGENAGRTLQHVAVVRVLKDFGQKGLEGHILHLSSSDLMHGADSRVPVRLVVFATDRKTGHVLGVAEQTLSR